MEWQLFSAFQNFFHIIRVLFIANQIIWYLGRHPVYIYITGEPSSARLTYQPRHASELKGRPQVVRFFPNKLNSCLPDSWSEDWSCLLLHGTCFFTITLPSRLPC